MLRRLLVVARKRDLAESVPEVEWLKALRPDSEDFFTFEEADALVTSADLEWRMMVLLALRTGLRQGELIGLR